MKSFVSHLFVILLFFTVVSTNGNHIYLEPSPDMVTGTDSACEAYWEELWDWLEAYPYAHIVYDGWVPSPRVINYDNSIPDDSYERH